MTPFSLRRLPQAALIAVATLGLVFGAARVAHAFTYGTANGVKPDGSAQLQDPDKKADDTTSHDGSVTFYSSGGLSLQFGARNAKSSFDAEYDSSVNRLFNPIEPDGR